MIAKKKNPNSNPTNAYHLFEHYGLCCGDVKRKVFSKYEATINTGNTPTLNKVKLGGAEIAFGIAIDTTSEKGLRMIIDKIKEAIASLGYGTDGVEFKVVGSIVTFRTYWSELVFDWLGNASNPFSKYDHKVVGSYKAAGSDELSAIGREEGNTFIVSALSTSPISNVKVMEGANTQRVSAAPNEDGEVAFNSTGQEGTKTFTVIATTEDFGDIETTLTHTF